VGFSTESVGMGWRTKKGMTMMTKTAARHRADKLEKMARDAIAQYNDEFSKGGEPLYPDWALQLLGLISDYDRMAFDLAKHRMEGKRGDNVVQFKRVAS
jgi:hypothetical protein